MREESKNKLNELFGKYESFKSCEAEIIETVDCLIKIFSEGGKLLLCGNGGSASDCEHIVGELIKGFILQRKLKEDLAITINNKVLSDALQYGLPAISLVSQTSFLTAYMNDCLPSAIFAQQVLVYGNSRDALLCISTSGNSLNCVYAAEVAKALNMKVISLTGSNDSKLSRISDITIKVPAIQTYQVQEMHLPIYHAICQALENEFYGD